MSANNSSQVNYRIRASAKARRTTNPVRNLLDNLKFTPNPKKSYIPLTYGDPTVFGNLLPDPNIIAQMEKVLQSCKYNGYNPSFGSLRAREAVANFVAVPDFKPQATDVFMASGCSGALEMAITVLADPGDNILIPRPGFGIYVVLCKSHGIQCKFYNLFPYKNWEVDLEQMASLIDANTRAILVNNPSNPCGSVFSRDHIRAIANVAERNRLPIIIDEVYAHFVFGGKEFVWFAEESGSVPVLSCGGITKRYLVPGWRMGWTVLFDRAGVMDEVRKGLRSLTQLILGPNTLVQAALPEILSKTPKSFYSQVLTTIENNAKVAFDSLSKVKGLTPLMPEGGMYMICRVDMDKFPLLRDDMNFVHRLVEEESVFVLPGQVLRFPNTFRIVLTAPADLVKTACERIANFCRRHSSRRREAM